MMIKFICYPKCTTCQKAKAWLDAHGVEYEERDIKLNNPTYEELSLWHVMSGIDVRKLFNTSGLLYKSMELKTKLPEMTDDEMLRLLSIDGMLVKRPLIVGEGYLLVGFREAEYAAKYVG